MQSAEGGKGKDKRERSIVVVRSLRQENDPADAHPSAHKSVLESANPRMDSECASGCTWSTAQATAPLWDSRPRSSQAGQVIQGALLTRPNHLLEGEGGFGGNSRAAPERLQGVVKVVRGRLLGWDFVLGLVLRYGKGFVRAGA